VKLDMAFPAFTAGVVGKMLRKAVHKHLTAYIRRIAPLEYHDILIPDYDFGVKRPVVDHGYLNALHDPKVKLLKSPSLSVVGPRELQVESGETFHADVIILANGFKTQELLTPMTIKGKNGAELPGIWRQEGKYASAYMGYVLYNPPRLLFAQYSDIFLVFVCQTSRTSSFSPGQTPSQQVTPP
jgi:cation diffusion facilitator CzcD-associated flavoprotein CzcO